MNEKKLKEMLSELRKGNIKVKDAFNLLKDLPFKELGFAKVDNHREMRVGFPEVVYCPGKTKEQITKIIKTLAANSDHNILATRANKEIYETIIDEIPNVEYYPTAQLIVVYTVKQKQEKRGNILVVSAGTSDIPVAEEAALTAEAMGNYVERLYDVGIAGIHRLISQKEKLEHARVIIVVAGMEGGLPSVVGGLVGKPIIAVPTSIGYGASFNGLAALLGMLNSCSSNVSVVNIDNGFGAGYIASLINKLRGIN